MENELLKARKDLAWINGGFYSEDSKAVVEAKILVIQEMIRNRRGSNR